MQKPIQSLVSAAIVALMSNAVQAASFSLYTEGSAAAIGNYAAGIAAEAADAATGWYNPAGLSLIHTQEVVLGGVGIFPHSSLSGVSTFSSFPLPPYVQTFSGLDGSKDGFVPSFHYALPLGPSATFGLSVVGPFGLVTEYSKTGPVRYASTLSDLFTTTVSPELGGRLNENFAIGAGIDLQYARVKFNRMLGVPTLLQFAGLPPNFLDSESYNKGYSTGVGFHAGVLALFNEDHTRIGLNYQSQVRQKFHGFSRLSGRLATPGLNITNPFSLLTSNPFAVAWSNNLSSNNIDFPEIITLSGYQDVNESLALLGSIVYTGWDSLQAIILNNAVAYAPPPVSNQVLVTGISQENYKNAWRFAVGANYWWNDQFMLRVGGGYDETPTNNNFRSLRIPDSNRWALSIGGHYVYTPQIAVDLGYTHLFAADSIRINRTDVLGTTTFYNVNARGKGNADLVGAQLTWIIDQPVPSPAPMK